MLPLLIWCLLQDGIDPKPLPVEKEGEGLAAKYPGDAGIALDSAVMLHENFESGDLKQWSETHSSLRTVEFDSKTIHGGSRSIKITATMGKDSGGNLWKRLKPGSDRMHLRFYVYFAPDHGYVHHFVTLCGDHPPVDWTSPGAGTRPAGDRHFQAGLDLHGDEGRIPAPGRWACYNSWCEMKGSWGITPRQDKIVKAETGKWICVELMIKCNTLGLSDGEQAFWVDGKGAGRWGGYKWRTDPALNVNGVWLNYYVTANAAKANHVEPTKVNQVYFDDIVVAREYIGPMKTSEGPGASKP